MLIRPFTRAEETDVILLWEHCGLTRPWNNPDRDIQRKLSTQSELFLVGELDGRIIASAMAGYDGHRGSVFYLCVHPDFQHKGYGKQLMKEIERKLVGLGCPKLNILVRTDNDAVMRFYEKLGYQLDAVSSYGKRLITDEEA